MPFPRLSRLAVVFAALTPACLGAADPAAEPDGLAAEPTALTLGVPRPLPPQLLRAWPVHVYTSGRAFYAVMSNGTVRVWGTGSNLGDGSASATLTAPTAVVDLDGVVSLAPAADHVCALRSDGSARCWGASWSGQVGNGTFLYANAPRPVAVATSLRFASLTSVAQATCGVATGAEARVYCWGTWSGQPNGAAAASPVATPLTGGLGVLGAGRFVARTADPTGAATPLLWAWGPEDFINATQLPQRGVLAAPAQMQHWTLGTARFVLADLQAGAGHACALDPGGMVACVGRNAAGQLGNWSTVDRATPTGTSPPFTQAASLSVGLNHTCVVRRDGVPFCWGSNVDGQLGDPRIVSFVAAPNAVPGLTDVREMAAGADRTCALRGDSTVWCWGGVRNGSPGLPTSYSPTRVTF